MTSEILPAAPMPPQATLAEIPVEITKPLSEILTTSAPDLPTPVIPKKSQKKWIAISIVVTAVLIYLYKKGNKIHDQEKRDAFNRGKSAAGKSPKSDNESATNADAIAGFKPARKRETHRLS